MVMIDDEGIWIDHGQQQRIVGDSWLMTEKWLINDLDYQQRIVIR